MKRFNAVLVVSVMFLTSFASSEFANATTYDGGFNVTRLVIQSDGNVSFGTTRQPNNTCSYFKFYLTFNSNSVAGKQMLAVLLAAKSTDTSIDVWYNNTSTPGGVDASCTTAIATGVALE
jgi:hypothetical protein